MDGLLAGGILGGNVQELLCCAQGLMAEHVDEYFVGHPADEGIDHVGIGDVGKLVALLGEALDVLPKGLVGPRPIVVEVP